MRQCYLLARHAFVCLSGKQVLLLDLRRDQYLALDDESSSLLAGLVVGWPGVPAPQASGSQSADSTIEDLLHRDLLTLDTGKGKSAEPVTTTAPTQTLLPPPELFGSPRSKLRLRHTGGLVVSAIAAGVAALWLRLSRIERVVTALSSRHHSSTLDEARARELVALFYRARPFLFSARNACLHDSLTLLLFLRRFHVPARWVFGVRTGPFAAHCWLQHEDMVLNDTIEHVRSYTPIMVV